jgi:hypothetical protein
MASSKTSLARLRASASLTAGQLPNVSRWTRLLPAILYITDQLRLSRSVMRM